jgi:hypothetical protein
VSVGTMARESTAERALQGPKTICLRQQFGALRATMAMSGARPRALGEPPCPLDLGAAHPQDQEVTYG